LFVSKKYSLIWTTIIVKTHIRKKSYDNWCRECRIWYPVFQFLKQAISNTFAHAGSYMFYMSKCKTIKLTLWLGSVLNWTPVLSCLMNILTKLVGTSRAAVAANTKHKGRTTILRNMHNCLQVLIYHWFHSVLHWNYRIHGSSQKQLHINPIKNVINLIIFGWIKQCIVLVPFHVIWLATKIIPHIQKHSFVTCESSKCIVSPPPNWHVHKIHLHRG